MNDRNLIPITRRTKSEQRDLQRKGGIASGEARRESKALAAALANVLDGHTADGLTRKEALVIKCVKNVMAKGDIKDLKIIAEILGELKQPQGAHDTQINVFASEQGAANTIRILKGG